MSKRGGQQKSAAFITIIFGMPFLFVANRERFPDKTDMDSLLQAGRTPIEILFTTDYIVRPLSRLRRPFRSMSNNILFTHGFYGKNKNWHPSDGAMKRGNGKNSPADETMRETVFH